MPGERFVESSDETKVILKPGHKKHFIVYTNLSWLFQKDSYLAINS